MRATQGVDRHSLLTTGILALFVMALPHIGVAGIINMGHLILMHNLAAGESQGTSWLSWLVMGTEWIAPLEPEGAAAARRALGHTALVTGDVRLSGRLLGVSAVEPVQLPIEVVTYAQQSGYLSSAVEIDMVTAHLLRHGKIALSEGQNAEGAAFLEAALTLRPSDLWANYTLLRASVPATATAREARLQSLTYFDPSALTPASPALLSFIAEIIPTLDAEAIWTPIQTEQVVALLVWQYSAHSEIEALLGTLVARDPADPRWLLYLGELYERRGAWKQAEKIYHQLLEHDDSLALPYFRLGVIAEAVAGQRTGAERLAQLQAAAEWYNHYQRLAPHDDAVILRLAELYHQLDTPAPVQVATHLREQEARHFAATLIGMEPEQLLLGDNLMPFGTFDSSALTYWRWTPHNMPPNFDAAAFLGDIDPLQRVKGEFALRTLGFWQQPDSGNDGARAGNSYGNFSIPPQTTWLLTFWYRTWGTTQPSPVGIWLTGTPESRFQGEIRLPPTEGEWHQEIILFHNHSPEAVRIQPLFRSWDVGSVWFDQIGLYPLQLPPDVATRIPPRIVSWEHRDLP